MTLGSGGETIKLQRVFARRRKTAVHVTFIEKDVTLLLERHCLQEKFSMKTGPWASHCPELLTSLHSMHLGLP